jgi:hypothetical protein
MAESGTINSVNWYCMWLTSGCALPPSGHDHLAVGDLATWVGSIGVVGALFAALYQIRTERIQRRRDEKDVLDRRRREQAERVSGWPGDQSLPTTPLILLNRSEEPVYEVVATLVMVQGDGARRGEDRPSRQFLRVLDVLPPGRWRIEVAGGWANMSRRPGVEVAFVDRSGACWIRRANGALEEIAQPPIDHYALGRPQELAIPQRDDRSP